VLAIEKTLSERKQENVALLAWDDVVWGDVF
jgi:hypothetical protein